MLSVTSNVRTGLYVRWKTLPLWRRTDVVRLSVHWETNRNTYLTRLKTSTSNQWMKVSSPNCDGTWCYYPRYFFFNWYFLQFFSGKLQIPLQFVLISSGKNQTFLCFLRLQIRAFFLGEVFKRSPICRPLYCLSKATIEVVNHPSPDMYDCKVHSQCGCVHCV